MILQCPRFEWIIDKTSPNHVLRDTFYLTYKSEVVLLKSFIRHLTILQASIWWWIIEKPPMGKSGLGSSRERGRNRVPKKVRTDILYKLIAVMTLDMILCTNFVYIIISFVAC